MLPLSSSNLNRSKPQNKTKGKSVRKGLLKYWAVRWGLMLSPVWVVAFVALWHFKAHAYAAPPSFRVMFYPDCHPAWAGGTIYPHGIILSQQDGTAKPIGPYCDSPVPYLPGFMPYIVGTDTRGVMVIDTTTNYCGAGDLYLGFAYTEYTYDQISWGPMVGSTNAVLMPDGYTESEWKIVPSLGPLGAFPKLANASPTISCPGGVGTGGQ